MPKKPKPIKHDPATGADPNRSSYNRGCRCDACRQANRAYAQTKKQRKYRRQYREADPSTKILTHGTRSAYNNGCRCADCTQANTNFFRQYRRDVLS